ncbi:MAG: coproporphyrinogen dehydrogenase HemZ [Oscillospiraceae bacterium]|nr:coproporphyrinogen dehydrogenase HemZ [Oscillospiraceae bacterium]
MKLYLSGHTFRYAMEQLQMSLFPGEKMEYSESPLAGDGAVSTLRRGRVYATAVTVITRDGRTCRAQKRVRAEASDSALRQALQQSYYLAALQCLPEAPPWGAFSGVRPTKIATRCLLRGGTARACDKLLRGDYFISAPRRALALECAEKTVQAARLLLPTDVSVYVGIPFCPTRCTYCSFVSQSVGAFGSLVAPYLYALVQEIAVCGDALRRAGRSVRSVYLGGGTPTTLSAAQLARLLGALQTHFDLSRNLELTVEAGRPETLSREKLDVLRSFGCTRISINPQTMNDAILQRIGRNHSSAQIVSAYAMAMDAGLSNVNMDLIAGLPGETPASFSDSLHRVLALAPTAVTVHTLAIKKAADLTLTQDDLPGGAAVAEMLLGATQALRRAGYVPYYLYRQKYMSGSFENVGWCKPGYECLYNIYMMEELHSILALGSGGVSKLNLPGGALHRLVNPKYPREYLEKIDTVCAQKADFFAAAPAELS